MKNLKVLLNSKVIFKINWVKSIISFNLVVMLVVSQISLLPISVLAAPEKVSGIEVSIDLVSVVYKDVDTYSAKVVIDNKKGKVFTPTSIVYTDGKNPDVALKTKLVKGKNEVEVTLKCGLTGNIVVKSGNDKSTFPVNLPLCTITNGDKEKPSRIGRDGKDIGDELYNTYAYTAPTKYSKSTCENPVGWILDLENSEEFSTVYVINKDPKVPTFSKDFPNNSLVFNKVSCGSLDKQNYVTGTKEVKVEELKNEKGEVVQKAETITKKVVAKVDSSIVQNKAGNYVNKANDFSAEFNKDPNKGWSFKNATDTITVANLKIAGKAVNKNSKVTISTKPDKITYEEILPNVDLEYVVTSSGIQKALVLKNAKALENDLTKIEYTLKSEKGGKITKKTEKTKLTQKIKEVTKVAALSEKVDTENEALENVTKEEIQKEVAALDTAKTVLTTEDQVIVAEQKVELEKIATDIVPTNTEVQKAAVETEIERITDKPLTNDTIEVEAVSTEKLVLGTPETLTKDAKGNYFIKKESFTLENGKLTILPDINSLKENKELLFPVRIDPNLTVPLASADAFVATESPNSTRGTNNYWHLAVGTRTTINGGYIGDNRSYIRFEMPNEIKSADQIVSSYLSVYVYDVPGGGATAYITDYCGKNVNESSITWNNQGDICGFAYGIVPIINMTVNGYRDSSSLNGVLQAYGLTNRFVSFGLYDSDTRYNGGAVFCSKDTRGDHLCRTAADIAPKLFIEYNNPRPSTPVNNTISGYDSVGKCNMMNGSGDCSVGKWMNLNASNVNDGQ